MPVAAERLVLPTPPLPLNNKILIHSLYANGMPSFTWLNPSEKTRLGSTLTAPFWEVAPIVARRRSRELIGLVNTAASRGISRSEQHRNTQVRFKSCHLGHFPFLFATSSYYIFLRRTFCVRFIVL